MFVNESGKTEAHSMNTTNIQSTVIRPANVIEGLIEFGQDDRASFRPGSQVSADELAGFGLAKLDDVGSRTIRLVNVIRLAKQLPGVTVPMIDENGQVKKNGDKAIVKQQPAFDYVCAKIAKDCKTASTWQNIKGLIGCAELADAKGWVSSPFAVKEAMGYLTKAGVVKTDDDGKYVVIGTDPVVKQLKSGVGVNAVRPVLDKAKLAANKKAETAGTPAPFPKKGNIVPITAPVADTAEKLDREIVSLIGRFEKFTSSSEKRDAFRKVIRENVKKLAVMAGLEVK